LWLELMNTQVNYLSNDGLIDKLLKGAYNMWQRAESLSGWVAVTDLVRTNGTGQAGNLRASHVDC